MRTAGVLVIGSLGCGIALGCGAWALELASRGVGSVDQAVALGATSLAAVLGAWYGLTAVVVALLQLAGQSRHRAVAGLRRVAATLGAPVLRRAATAGLGAGLLLGASPAVGDSGDLPLAGPSAPPAAQSEEHDGRDGRDGCDGREYEVPADLRPGFLSRPESLPSPEPSPAAPGAAPGTDQPGAPSSAPPAPEPAGPPAAPHSEPRPTSAGRAAATSVGITTASTAPEPELYVVQPGDSLWSITAEHLGGTPSNAQISAAWPRWHAANRAVIGADPNLIHPGQELTAPDQEDER